MCEVFHYAPSSPQAIAAYSRCVPLQCDTKVIDTMSGSGHFDTVNHCFCADAEIWMFFNVNILLSNPPSGACISAWLYYNQMPTVVGATNGEVCGTDIIVYQPPPTLYNISATCSKILALQPGDKVWAVPGINCGGAITNAFNGGYDTVNFFEGFVIQ